MASVFKGCGCANRSRCRHGWRVRWREPGDRAGRVRQATFPTKRQADAFAHRVEADKTAGTYLDPRRGRLPFNQVHGDLAHEPAATPLDAGHLPPPPAPPHQPRLRTHPAGRDPPRTHPGLDQAPMRPGPGPAHRTHQLRHPRLHPTGRRSGRTHRSESLRTHHPPRDPTRPHHGPLPHPGTRHRRSDESAIRHHRDRRLRPGTAPGRSPRAIPLPHRLPAPHLPRRPPGDHLRTYGIPTLLRRSHYNQNVLKPALTAAALPRHTTFHTLRHSYASTALTAGLPILEISRHLGHATTAETTGTYGRLLPDTDDRTRHTLDHLWNRNDPGGDFAARGDTTRGEDAGQGREEAANRTEVPQQYGTYGHENTALDTDGHQDIRGTTS